MPCDTKLKPRQTIQQRAAEVRAAVEKIAAALAAGRVKPVVDRRTGAIAFGGIADSDRDGLTDACVYRRIMATGSALARAAIARAEQLAGRGVDRQAVGRGVHSHDGGRTFHDHKG
jgi:hypothetical protein